MAKENVLERNCLEYSKSREKDSSILVVNIHENGWCNKGFPDLLGCINGHFVVFELKVGKNNLEPSQVLWKSRIEKSGGEHFEIRTIEEFREVLNDLIRKYT